MKNQKRLFYEAPDLTVCSFDPNGSLLVGSYEESFTYNSPFGEETDF